MARAKTKKQKKAADLKVATSLHSSPSPTKVQSSATVFSQSQVHLVYRDVVKTMIVTGIVAVVLLSIFLYMR